MLNRDEQPPAGGWFPFVETADEGEPASSGWLDGLGFHDPMDSDWLSMLKDVPELAAISMGRLEPAAEARRAWVRAGMAVWCASSPMM
ncbi:MAG: hypothetical protein J0H49_31245 [Acidobacteria bacterium]|nr:hypothetical protein [Acidobacteriota bacterium]